MIPLRDENPSGSVPYVTRGLIVVNCLLFLYEILLGPDLRQFTMDWGLVPQRLHAAFVTGAEPLTVGLVTLVTSMFLHGGWMHLIGNMWYLWIFGDNIEDRFGPVRFLAFYLACGIFAGVVQYLANPDSSLPTIGASGAIAGVLGAYAAAFPRARVVTFVPIIFYFRIMMLPAALVLGFWFVIQFFSGALALGMAHAAGGIAWWAHIGGFALGFLTMRIAGSGRREPRWSSDPTLR